MNVLCVCDSTTLWQCDSMTWQCDSVTVGHCESNLWQCDRLPGSLGQVAGGCKAGFVSIQFHYTTLICSDSDGTSSFENCKKLKSLLDTPEDCSHIIKYAGHLAMLEKSVEVNKIGSCWQSCPAWVLILLLDHMIRIFAEFVFFNLLYGIQPSKCLSQTLNYNIRSWIKTRTHKNGMWLKLKLPVSSVRFDP